MTDVVYTVRVKEFTKIYCASSKNASVQYATV